MSTKHSLPESQVTYSGPLVEQTIAPASKTRARQPQLTTNTACLASPVDEKQPCSGGTQDEKIAALESSISTLWSDHRTCSSDAKKSKQALLDAKLKLSERLSDLKSALVGTGREGRWAQYLREQNIPLSTADRYVTGHHKAQTAPKLLTEEPLEITLEQVKQLAKKVAGTVNKRLKKDADREAFLKELGLLLNRTERQI